jgi:3-oxoacyl-[acyl-carrier protein] reductase
MRREQIAHHCSKMFFLRSPAKNRALLSQIGCNTSGLARRTITTTHSLARASPTITPNTQYPRLRGKVFVVTGAGSGIGRSTALRLASEGANVGLLDLRNTQAVLDQIEHLGHGKAISLPCDVSKASEVKEAIENTAGHFGRLDGAANLAGYGGDQGLSGRGYALDKLKDHDWDHMMAVNIDGVKNCLRAEFNSMKAGGSIVNAASICGQYGAEYAGPYCASKWAVIGLTKVAAREAGPRLIRVNAIAP